jgi:hypothetical protein
MLTVARITILIFIFILTSCGQSTDLGEQSPKSSDILAVKAEYPSIDTARVLLSNNYYQFIRSTDSTSHIKWGNKTFSNISNKPVDNDLISKGGVTLKWYNDKFIALYRDSGSDTWLHILLPITKGQDVKIYENPLCYDREKGIVVYEYFFGTPDTILVAENILTNKRQYIVNKWTPCISGINHYCIDSIRVFNDQLYLEWFAATNGQGKLETKRIKLDI